MAAARTVSIVLIGRYTTFAGDVVFRTLPVNVQQYDRAELTAWRGEMPAGGGCEMYIDGSTDGETWEQLNGVVLVEDQEHSIDIDLDRPLIRARVELSTTSAFPVTTCYLVGALIRRRD